MEELRAVQRDVKAQSERHLELSEAIDRNNTELYKTSTHNHTVRNEREAAASHLAALAQEQEMLAAQLQELQRKEQEGEAQLHTYAQMQEAATKRLHEAQSQELASHTVRRAHVCHRAALFSFSLSADCVLLRVHGAQKDVAMDLAELEGLRAFMPILDHQAEQAVQDVQHKNQLLQEQTMQRIRLEQHVEQLYGPDALGVAGAATRPFSAELLHVLAREYAEVQTLRQQVRQHEAGVAACASRRAVIACNVDA